MERREGRHFKRPAPAQFSSKLLAFLPVLEAGVTHDIPQIIGASASVFATVTSSYTLVNRSHSGQVCCPENNGDNSTLASVSVDATQRVRLSKDGSETGQKLFCDRIWSN